MNNILVTGSNGQLGSELRFITGKGNAFNKFIFTDIEDLDITNKMPYQTFWFQIELILSLIVLRILT